MNVVAFDTEDDGAGNFTQGGTFDGERVVFYDDRVQMAHAIAATRATFVTFNLEYDLVALYWPQVAPVSFYRSAGRILSARVGAARFRDLVWSMGGVGMRFCAGLVGMEKGELDARSRDYLENDLRITYAVHQRLLDELAFWQVDKPGSTLAANALRVFKAQGGRVDPFPPELEHIARAAYYGGRTEVFNYAERTVNGYDVNSMFPAVMLGHDYPAGGFKRTRNLDNADLVCADVTVPNRFVPVLPVRRDRLIFPTGSFRGTWTGHELRYAVEAGAARVDRLLYAFEGQERVRPFDVFCANCFARRANDGFSNYHAKRTLNSLYGKLAQSGALEHVSGFLDAQDVSLLDLPARDYNPLWSAIVTARARIQLHRYLERAGDTLHYCDTDSIFLSSREARRFAGDVGPDLGQLKLEYERGRMLVKAPKLYRITTPDGETIYKSRGVSDSAASEFFELGRASYAKPMRLREAVRRRMTPNVWAAIEKSFGVGQFDKRRRLPGGRTVPLEITA